MNRLLLQEWLDELRSDDPEWLCESQRNPKHRKKGNSPRHKDRAAPLRDGPSGGISVPRDSTASRIPVPMERTRQSIPNTTESVKQKIRRFKNGDIPIDKGTISAALSKLRYVFSLKYKGRSAYGPITTPRGIMGLRLSDHNAAGDNFEYDEGDFFVSIFIEGTIYPHVPTRIPYREFYFPNAVFEQDKMAVAQAIADIVSCAIETGEAIDKSGLSIMKDYPVEISKDGTPIQATPQGGQPPQLPAPPPDEPGVKESLAKYFQGTHDMKFKLLKEAALEELINEDWEGHSSAERKAMRDNDTDKYRDIDEIQYDGIEGLRKELRMRSWRNARDFYMSDRLKGDEFNQEGGIEGVPRKLRIMHVLRSTNAKSIQQALDAYMELAKRVEALNLPDGELVDFYDVFDDYHHYLHGGDSGKKINGVTLIPPDSDLNTMGSKRANALLKVAHTEYTDPLEKVEAFLQVCNGYEGAGLPEEGDDGVLRAGNSEVMDGASCINNKIHEVPGKYGYDFTPIYGKRFGKVKDRFGRRIKNFPN